MTDPTREPLHGVALYNPHLLGKEELKRDFIARQEQLDRLVGDLRTRTQRTPQHHLILGQRGMGKSTLLRRLAYAIEDEDDLHAAYVALSFPEEQYNIKHLGDLWLNCLDALSDALEGEGKRDEAEKVDAIVASIPQRPSDAMEERAREALFEEARHLGRRFVLLLDNIDLVFERTKSESWKLRDVLQATDQLIVIGASAAAIEPTYKYGEAFYDFFKVMHLGGLDDAETRELLLALAARHGNDAVRTIVETHPERIAPIRMLAGGNPRTMATLYEILAAGGEGDVRSNLEALLDKHTPIYKARFEALSAQAQQVVSAVCTRWDPVIASTIAADTGLEVNKVSTQLDRLVTDGIVEKVAAVDKATGRRQKRTAFQIAERFFNIWYLMRTSRRVRRKLVWLVRFLEAFHGRKGLRLEAKRLLAGGREGELTEHDLALSLSLIDCLNDGSLREALAWRVATSSREARRYLVADGPDGPDVGKDLAELAEGAQRAWEAIPEAAKWFSPVMDEKEMRQMLTRYLEDPVQPWELKRKILLVEPVHDDEMYGRAMFVCAAALASVVERVDGVYRSLTPDVGHHLRSGLDITDRRFAAVLGVRSSKARAKLDALRKTVVDAAALSDALMDVMFMAAPMPIGEIGVLSDAKLRATLEAVRKIAIRHPTWSLAQALSLVTPSEGDDLELVLQQLATLPEDAPIFNLLSWIFAYAAHRGLAAVVRDRLDRASLSDRWLPAREALNAVALGSSDVLDALAPEVREPAKKLYDKWTAVGSAEGEEP